MQILEELHRFPHQHIVSHIACWQRHGVDYILLPKARCDLKAMLTRQAAPSVNRATVKWLFSQLYGLADALKHFHALENKSDSTGQGSNVRWAYHHDIKPQNILIFELILNQHPIFKLSDFGAGRISNPNEKGLSHKENEVVGTLTYFAPEAHSGGKGASRPFDVWSLGCVFLELLVWLFQLFEDKEDEDGHKITQHVAHFEHLREHFPGANPYDLDDSFYWKPKTGSFELKPPVVDVLLTLKSTRCQNMWAFERLIDVIGCMLTVDVERRSTASELEEALRRIRLGIDREIHDMPPDIDSYAAQYAANLSDKHRPKPSPKAFQTTVNTGITAESTASWPSPIPLDNRSVGLTTDDSHSVAITSSDGPKTLHSSASWETKTLHVSAPSPAGRPKEGPDAGGEILVNAANIKNTGFRHEIKDLYISDSRLHEWLESQWPAGKGSQYATRVSSRGRALLPWALITLTTGCKWQLGILDPGPT